MKHILQEHVNDFLIYARNFANIESATEVLNRHKSLIKVSDLPVFAKTIIGILKKDISVHQLPNHDDYIRPREYGIYVAEKMLEDFQDRYPVKINPEDLFTVSEVQEITTRLDDLEEEFTRHLKDNSVTNETIAELIGEIETLKEHLKFSKQDWLDLALGKAARFFPKPLVEKLISKVLWEIIKQYGSSGPLLLPSDH